MEYVQDLRSFYRVLRNESGNGYLTAIALFTHPFLYLFAKFWAYKLDRQDRRNTRTFLDRAYR